jgi:hypothetical protein
VFYVIDTGSTGSGGAPGDCLCIPSAFTLTLAMLVTLSGRRFCCPSQPRRGPGGLMSCGALWEGRPYSTRERADKARENSRTASSFMGAQQLKAPCHATTSSLSNPTLRSCARCGAWFTWELGVGAGKLSDPALVTSTNK